ncbi:Uncharacterized protein APZ42_025255 [Daphnia magna]|uniref:RNA-directed DNA polymerase n=1 Tax=Daphnia magna TaxID=35525 RepID=A0A164TAU7_9CRUS|nr:Uncharacterized protein APZ42_025255 [Daphnia magna]
MKQIPATVSNEIEGSCIVTPSGLLLAATSPSTGHALVRTNLENIAVANPSPKTVGLEKGVTLGILEKHSKAKEIEETQEILTMDASKNWGKLTKEEKEETVSILSKLFIALNGEDLGYCSVVKHNVNSAYAPSTHDLPYKSAWKERAVIQNQVEGMLRRGVMKPSDSLWSSPVILIKKKDGTWRFCVDYRKLNAVTVTDSYSLPRMADTLSRLEGTTFFSTSNRHHLSRTSLDDVPHILGRRHNLLSNLPTVFGKTSFSAEFPCSSWVEIEMVKMLIRGAHVKSVGTPHLKSRCGTRSLILETVQSFPSPNECHSTANKVKRVQSFLGLCSYYRRHIQGFASITRPFTTLTKKEVPFKWGEDQASSFNALKQALTSASVLANPNYDLPMKIFPDTCGYGIGGVLAQRIEGAELSLQVPMLCVGLRSESGHRSSSSMLVNEQKRTCRPSGTMELVASGIRQNYCVSHCKELEDDRCFIVKAITFPGLYKAEDESLAEKKKACRNWNQLIVKLQNAKSRAYHGDVVSGHLGMNRTPHKICDRFFRLKMALDITRPVQSCVHCQSRKGVPDKPPGLLQCIKEKKMIIVTVDYLMKWVELKAMPTEKAADFTEFFVNQILLRNGAPEQIITDRGKCFTSDLMQAVVKKLHTNHETTSSYHPQANGTVERINDTFAAMLSMYTRVYGVLTIFLLYGRETRLPIDSEMDTDPNPLLTEEYAAMGYADQADLIKAKEIVKTRMERVKEKQKEAYDARYRELSFQAGDLVLVYKPFRKIGKSEKLLHRWLGSFRVLRQTTSVNYEMISGTGRGKSDTVHVARMKSFHEATLEWQSTQTSMSGNNEIAAEKDEQLEVPFFIFLLFPSTSSSLILRAKANFKQQANVDFSESSWTILTDLDFGPVDTATAYLKEKILQQQEVAERWKNQGSHTSDVVSSHIEEVMKKFKIREKVCCIVKDNGKNIKKTVQSLEQDFQERENARRVSQKEALKLKEKNFMPTKLLQLSNRKGIQQRKQRDYPRQSQPLWVLYIFLSHGNQEKPDLVSDSNDTENELEMICIDLGIELDEGEIGDEVSVSGILETSITKDTDERGIEFDYNRSTLCEDFSCFSHCVNLIATTDFKKVLESGRASCFKLAHEKAFGKLQRLGNLSSGTVRASKIISDTIGCQLKTPCATRWNSEFDSFKCVMDQPEDKLNSAMKKLKLELLDEADRVLLKEQVAIMSPLTKYLDVLQSKKTSLSKLLSDKFERFGTKMSPAVLNIRSHAADDCSALMYSL